MSTKKNPKEVKMDVLWDEIKGRWAELRFDPTLLKPVEYWSKERRIHPLDHLLSIAQRAIQRGEFV